MREACSKVWWLFLVRGIMAIGFGVLAFAYPGLTALILVLLFGAYTLVDGVTSAIQSFQIRGMTDAWWLLLLGGVLGVVVAVLAFTNPTAVALFLVLYIAVWSIATGILQIIFALRYREEIEGEGWLVIGGILSMVVGFLFLASPQAGALTLVWLIAGYAVVLGAFLIGMAFRLRAVGRGAASPSAA
ncbi:MAG: HdeD family acid-resistance protein [Sandaracinaceae bacterium]